MKNLYESLLDDEEDLVNDDTVIIQKFIEQCYKIDGEYKIQDSIVDINGDVRLVKDVKNLTNRLFKFGKVTGAFKCVCNRLLESLEGGPEEVGGTFDCSGCSKLENLKGSPKKVMDDFNCSDCAKLENLEGAPEIISGDFVCSFCPNLQSLKGLPKKISGTLSFRSTPAYSKEESWKLIRKNKIRRVFKVINPFRESLLDDEEDLVNDDNIIIERFLKDNYQIIGKYIITNNKVDINGDIYLEKDIKNLTNGVFEFNEVKGTFDCTENKLLEDLTGAPKKCQGFDCFECSKLKSLKGAPAIVNGDFICFGCSMLEDLTGAPKEVKGDFVCNNCRNLKSLKGLPKKIEGSLEFVRTPAYSKKESWDLAKKNNIKNIYKTYEDTF